MSFYDWLMEHLDQDTSIGDLARDVQDDDCLEDPEMVIYHLYDAHCPSRTVMGVAARALEQWRDERRGDA